MIAKIKKFTHLVTNYGGVFLRYDTAARFWYLDEVPVVTDNASLARYKESSCPFYLMDYKKKLNYKLKRADNIIELDYGEDIGRAVNPEAAFIYTLALCDKYLLTGCQQTLDLFFYYIDYFLSVQDEHGSWLYYFDWYNSISPWGSALAQSRGASAMLRAWLLSGESCYKEAAIKAFQLFNVPCNQGGYLAKFPFADCYYFEEYPKAPSAVLNGFMVCVMGLWEMQHWFDSYKELYVDSISSLAKMLPFYTTTNWTLYDLDDTTGVPNLNSPRYHQLIISYLAIIATFNDNSVFTQYLKQWQTQVNKLNKLNAVGAKLKRKILYK